MKCPKCGSKMLLLITSYVCDNCNPPKGGLVKGNGIVSNPCTKINVPIQANKNLTVPPVCRMITIKDINFYDNCGFEISIPNRSGTITFSKNETKEIYSFIQMNLTNRGKTFLHGLNGPSLRITHIVDGAELQLEMHFPGYMIKILSHQEYLQLLGFMTPFLSK